MRVAVERCIISKKKEKFLHILFSFSVNLSTYYLIVQGVHKILSLFEDFKFFRTLIAFLGFPSVSVCVVHNGRLNTSAAAELAEFRKITF